MNTNDEPTAKRETCESTKGDARCIKFPGHPGRCRFGRTYNAAEAAAMHKGETK